MAGSVVVVAASVVVVVADSEVVVASSVVVVALAVVEGVVAAASVVSTALLSLLHAATVPITASSVMAAPKRWCRDVFDRGEYMVITTSKELGERRLAEREAFQRVHSAQCGRPISVTPRLPCATSPDGV